ATGTVKVTATPAGSGGRVLVNGAPTTGSRTITGLEPGDEISVIFDDDSGRSAYSLIYLPTRFPILERTTPASSAVAPGHVLLSLSDFGVGSPFFETAVDRNGVPVHVHTEWSSAIDFKQQPNGAFTSSRQSAATTGRSGGALVELGEDLEPASVHQTVGRNNTDGHDSIRTTDGRTILLGYEPNSATGKLDAVVQELDSAGNVTLDWNSADHVDIASESVVPATNNDYAHINSVVETADGNLLLSFRHLSAVFKIARRSEDGHQAGDVLWRLGGRTSDFTFPDDALGGPCAQHTASELPNGNILIFDNGSADATRDMCVDPQDRANGTQRRASTRITEYALDEERGAASLISSYDEGGFALFAGGVVQLPNGNRLIGWAAARESVASEINGQGQRIWSIRDTNTDLTKRLFTYRAASGVLPDNVDPVVSLTLPASVAQGSSTTPAFSCRDNGGSGLADCATTGLNGDRLDTRTPGTHEVTVTATDAAGNTDTATASYVVTKAATIGRPDAMAKASGQRYYTGNNVYGGASKQTVRATLGRVWSKQRATLRITNDASATDRYSLRASASNSRFRVRYLAGTRDVTAQIEAGTLMSPYMRKGQQWTLTVEVTRRAGARRGDYRTFIVAVTSRHEARTRDSAGFRVSAR
ncbi:MAG TPA: aryl-sulfate sulfotransferase, partial [Nocardioides sp.]